jgi:hypothetical protein
MAVGTRGMPAISVEEMCQRYRNGEALVDVALRAQLNYKAVRTLLEAHGVRMRTRKESLQLSARRRAPWRSLMPGQGGES